MSEYTIQADKFLADTGTRISFGEPEYKKHFAGDTQCRWVFPVKITRGGRRFSVKFGQSIAAGAEEPSAYDVLACLTKYNPGSFESFCGDYGYDTDSRSAERTWKAVCREWAGVERLWGDCLDQLREIA